MSSGPPRVEREAVALHLEWLARYANDVWFLFDSDLKVIEANERAQAVYGYSRREVLAMTLEQLRAPDTRGSLLADLARVRDGPGEVFETSHQRRDGSTFPVEVSARAFMVGGHRYYQSVIRDITERRAAEVELARHANLLHSVQDAVIGLDAELRITSWNPAAQAMYGWPERDAMGRRCAELLCGDGGCTRRCIGPASGGHGQSVTHVRRDRTPLIVEAATSPVVDPRGMFAGYVSVHRDVTERRQAFEHAAYQAMLLESLAEAVVGLTATLEIRSWNRAAERTFGYSAAEVSGRSILDTLQPRVAGMPFEAILAKFASSGHMSFEGVARAKGGEAVDVEIVVATVRGAASEPTGHVAVIRDVRERKRVEATLRHMERLAAIGTLAAGMAHEINNPLSYVIGNLGFARDELAVLGPGGAAKREAAETLAEVERSLLEAEQGARRVGEIVHGLRVYARGEAEARARMDVRLAVRWAATVAAASAGRSGTLTIDLAEVPLVEANEVSLSQVFSNLIVNALQSVAGSGDVKEVRVATSTTERGWASVAIRDTGPGIPPDLLPRVFDPFFTTKPVGVGTGLGLSICDGIVRSLGGEIRVETELGRGSCFTVLLPPARVPAASNEPLRPAELAAGARDRRPHATLAPETAVMP